MQVSNKTQTPLQTLQPNQAPSQPGQTQERAPSFKEAWTDIQAKMGAKPEKPREIKKTLDKDDFLKIMITQMQHQDPTKPFEADKLASEIAQITSVEQLQNVNRALTKLATQNRPLERLAMTNLLGKTVTVDKNRFLHQKGTNESLSFTLPEEAKSVKVALISEKGEVVLEKDLGAQKAGLVSFSWDGKKSNFNDSDTGNYVMQVQAKGKQEQNLSVNAQARVKIIGISYQGEEPVFLVGDRDRQEKVTMNNIIQIDDADSTVLPQALQQNLAGKPQSGDQKSSSYFSFTPGVGSQNLEQAPSPAKPNQQLVQQALQQVAQQLPDTEKGFPNGLSNESEVEQQQQPINEMKGGEGE